MRKKKQIAIGKITYFEKKQLVFQKKMSFWGNVKPTPNRSKKRNSPFQS
jgi:hypothetical protein